MKPAKAEFSKVTGTAVPVLIFLIAWELISWIAGAKNVPGVWDTVSITRNSFLSDKKLDFQGLGPKGFWPHVLETLCYYTVGLLAGVVLGIRMSLFLFFNPKFRKVTGPLVEFVRIIPPLIIAPFLLVIFQTNPVAKLIIVMLYTSLSLNIFCLNAIDHLDQNYFYLIKLMNISQRKAIKDIIRPAMLPGIVGGLRVNVAMSLGVLIVGEAIGPFNGIGKILNVMPQFSDASYIFACITWSVLIVLLFDLMFYLYFRKKLRWHH